MTALVNGRGTLQAGYRYDPYGRWLSGGGTLASANGLRFSSKPWVGFAGSTTSGLYYYGYRFYEPSMQRWLNRDPFDELGFEVLLGGAPDMFGDGANLYHFVGNDPLNEADADGLLAGASTLPLVPRPPPIVTPKPGPPDVTICTVEFSVVYTWTALVCNKTGVHDKLGDLIYKRTYRKSDLEKCKDDRYDSYLSDVEFCKGQRTKRQREYCYRQAFRLYVDCLKGCEKQYGGT